MERTLRTLARTISRPLTFVAALVVASSLAGPPATAGIRDMVKSAKEKAAQKAEPKSGGARGCEQVEFSNAVLELTGERLDKLIAGLKASDPTRAGQGQLILKQDQLRTQISELRDKHGEAIAESRSKQDEAEACYREAIEEGRRRRFEADQAKMMANPASAEKLLKLIARLNDAQLKGDKEAEKKAQQELDAMMSPSRADSLAARLKCPTPTPHPQAVRMDALEQEASSIDERVRELDLKARKVESETSGMTPGQFGMARERAEMYLAQARSGSVMGCFTVAEREALASRKDALKAALGV